LPLTGPFDVVSQVQDFAPGAKTALQTHPGQVVVTVLQDELTFHTQNSMMVYRAGESFVELPNTPAQASNVGNAAASVMMSYVVPQGVALSAPAAQPRPATPAQQPPARPVALPNTGADALWSAFVVIAIAILLLGAFIRRHGRATER
jgi:LPXTG-motif cell wall-anchored protein